MNLTHHYPNHHIPGDNDGGGTFRVHLLPIEIARASAVSNRYGPGGEPIANMVKPWKIYNKNKKISYIVPYSKNGYISYCLMFNSNDEITLICKKPGIFNSEFKVNTHDTLEKDGLLFVLCSLGDLNPENRYICLDKYQLKDISNNKWFFKEGLYSIDPSVKDIVSKISIE